MSQKIIYISSALVLSQVVLELLVNLVANTLPNKWLAISSRVLAGGALVELLVQSFETLAHIYLFRYRYRISSAQKWNYAAILILSAALANDMIYASLPKGYLARLCGTFMFTFSAKSVQAMVFLILAHDMVMLYQYRTMVATADHEEDSDELAVALESGLSRTPSPDPPPSFSLSRKSI